MKYLVVFLLAISFSNKLSAQEVSYWVGKSAHPDPITRHHEAFMEAFMQYLQSRGAITDSASQVAEKHSESTSTASESCKIETISSVTYEGQEILTIAVGNGVLVKYHCVFEILDMENEIYNETLLNIENEEDRGKSVHKYLRTDIVNRNNANQTIKSYFEYSCNSNYVKK